MAKAPLTKKLFVYIDKLFYNAQNSRKDVRKKDDLFEIELDIPYDGRTELNKLDVYRLKDSGKKPVVIYLHGGGFTAGDKSFRKDLSKWLALNGYHVVNANYALAPEEVFPAPVQDAVKACNWAYDNADKYGFDMEKVILFGDSAGAYLSMQTALIAFNKYYSDKVDAKLKFKPFGVVLDCGLYDMEDILLRRKWPADLGAKLLCDCTGCSKADYENYTYRDVISPINNVTEDCPPTLVIYSKYDVFCKGEAEKLIEKFKEKGVYFEEYAAKSPTSNHVFPLNQKNKDAKAADAKTLDFMERLCGGKIK